MQRLYRALQRLSAANPTYVSTAATPVTTIITDATDITPFQGLTGILAIQGTGLSPCVNKLRPFRA